MYMQNVLHVLQILSHPHEHGRESRRGDIADIIAWEMKRIPVRLSVTTMTVCSDFEKIEPAWHIRQPTRRERKRRFFEKTFFITIDQFLSIHK